MNKSPHQCHFALLYLRPGTHPTCSGQAYRQTDGQTDKDALVLPPALLFLPFSLHGFLLLKVAADKSIYLGQIVSEKLPLELFGTKLPL